MIIQVLSHTRTPLPGPVVANGILGIDGEGNHFVEWTQALSIRGQQGPALPRKDGEAVFEIHLPPQLPLARVEAVALNFIRGGCCTQEIGFVVTARLPVANLALCK